MGHYILGIPGNREDLFGRPTCELNRDIADIFSLLSTATHTVVGQDGIKISKKMMMNIPQWIMSWVWVVVTCGEGVCERGTYWWGAGGYGVGSGVTDVTGGG